MGLLKGFLNMIETGGLPILFLLVFLEGNPAVGSFIPGQVIVIFIGFLISVSGIFNIYWTIFWVFLGAFLGDIFGYILGKRLGVKGLDMFGIKKNSIIYKSSYSFFKRYGPWSVILGREFNLTRAFMPFFAGCFKMNYIKFIFFASFSCLIWSILSVYLGYYFGFIIVDNFNFIIEFVIVLIIYLFLVFFMYKNLKNFYKDNAELVYKYSAHNFIFLFILIFLFIILMFIAKSGNIMYFNKKFIILSTITILHGLKYFLYNMFFIIMFWGLFLLLLVNRKFRMLVVYFWSFIFSFFFTFIISIFMKKWFGFIPFFSIILITVFVFYLWIIIRMFIINKKTKKRLTYFLISILFLIILHKSIISGNYLMSLISFIIGAIETELILLLSHYQIFDKCLSNIRFSNNSF